MEFNAGAFDDADDAGLQSDDQRLAESTSRLSVLEIPSNQNPSVEGTELSATGDRVPSAQSESFAGSGTLEHTQGFSSDGCVSTEVQLSKQKCLLIGASVRL